MVKDTGCGMDDETKTRIFDPFFTTKTIGEGTGLGLFVVQNIIDKYKGVITVESEIGGGSCFRVYLPLANEKFYIENNLNSKDISTENKTILIVDDNEEIIKVLKRGLEYLGYQVTAETDSLKALKMFQTEFNKYNLIITDYMMPNLKGAELAAAVKETSKDTGVILITGYMDENKNIIGNNEFIDACISKPVELAALSETIKKVLSKYTS
jgi:CheY-like chemotaxis protein